MAKASPIGETTYERFERMINALPKYEHANFTSRIIARFSELHDLELRDILAEEYADLQKAMRGDGKS